VALACGYAPVLGKVFELGLLRQPLRLHLPKMGGGHREGCGQADFQKREVCCVVRWWEAVGGGGWWWEAMGGAAERGEGVDEGVGEGVSEGLG
jgi:hypothetical protein